MIISRRLGILAGAIGLFVTSLSAETVLLVDFDNTIVETRPEHQGVFQTGFKLFRIDQRSTTLQRVPNGPREIVVTGAEFEAIEKFLGKGNGFPGALNKEFKLSSGETIYPGEYYVRQPDTFDYFNEGERGQNHLLEDFLRAEERAKDGEGTWKGPFWEPFEKLMSDPVAASKVSIVTARGHSEREWEEFFEYLIKKGHIKFMPKLKHIFNIGRPEFDQLDPNWSVTEKKIRLLELIAYRLHRVPVEATDEKLSREGDGKEFVHTLILVDDKPETVRAGFEKLQALAQSKTVWAKFGLYNMGLEDEVERTERPRYLIFDEIGGYREATEVELTAELLAEPSCAEALAAAKK